MKEYGKIRWMEYYDQAPESAEFIVRIDNSSNVRLEQYDGFNSSIVLKFFEPGSLDKEMFEETLAKCRNIVNSTKTIWVEKPLWKWIQDNPELFK